MSKQLKPCLLPVGYANIFRLLEQVPEAIRTQSPERLALYLAAKNTAYPSNAISYKDVANQVNAEFGLEGKSAFTPIKLGKLFNDEIVIESILYEIKTDLQDQQQEAPQKQEKTDQFDYMHPKLLQGTMMFMEFATHLQGNKEAEATLADLNRQLTGDTAYKNPLIETVEMPRRVAARLADTATTTTAVVQQRSEEIRKGMNRLFGAASTLAEKVTNRAQADWQVVQATFNLASVTKSDPAAGAEDMQAVLARFQQAVSRD
ncbi:MAG: hypothetical protein KME45_26900 [Stenomitos rutilans HA7619-LM2]|jgi:broad specificity phosphatase PhoE|nr:hypothetical protein [Stenomitos rutilans HA7619-LM2]